MANGIARKGDADDLGYTIESDCSADVKVNGQPVALKGSLMNDGAAITNNVGDTVRVNGRYVALKGSGTEYHENEPKGEGTIQEASDDVRIGSGSGKVGVATGTSISGLFAGAVPAKPYRFTGPVTAAYQQLGVNVPDVPGAGGGDSPSAIPAAADIKTFLDNVLRESSKWTRGQPPLGPKGNANIVECFKQSGAPQLGDRDKWCAAFVNFVLKQCGYKCAGFVGSIEYLNSRAAFGGTLISDPLTAQPGDIAIFSYGHVAFVYTNSSGKMTFCGGNQDKTATIENNNPVYSTVSIAWPGGGTTTQASVIGIVRPVKA